MDYTDNAELFAEVVRKSNQLIVAYDDNVDKFYYSNPAFKALCVKYGVDCSRPTNFFRAIHPEDQPYVLRTYTRFLNHSEIEPLEFRLVGELNKPAWLCATAYRVHIGGREVMFLQADDITAAKENDEILNKFASKKNAILHILSHDLTGPLGMIRNLSSLLTQNIHVNENEQVIKLVRTIEQINEQNINLLHDFLNAEFLESAQVELVKARIDLVSLLGEIVGQYQNMAELSGRSFHFDTALQSLAVNLDAPKFQQVINNLIWNAIKFTPESGTIRVGLIAEEETIHITVSDTGIGIPEKFHENLFDQFTPARRPGLKGEPSVGLGMHLIKTIIEWHNGTISFTSHENEGSRFFIRLPLS